MKANIEIEGDKIRISLWDLFRQMSKEDKIKLVDHLSCENEVIHMVADQLVYGYTNDVSCGSSSHDASDLSSPLDKYRRLIAKMSSEVAKDEITNLEMDLKRLKYKNKQLTKYTWRVYHQFELRYTPLDIIKGKILQRIR